MKTHFASYKRASRDRILKDYQKLRSADYINELVGALPYVATILNNDRQIVFSNEALLKKIGLNLNEVLGKRPGEALNCIHSDTMKAGCGTSENCQVCGAVKAIIQCQETGKTVTDECRIRVHGNQEYEECLDLEVTATPFHLDKQTFIIFTARDISSEKRREALEHIFFHDVINTAGTLQGIVDLLKQLDDPKKIRNFIDLLSVVSQDLIEEILNQKSLMAAENGELVVNNQKFYLQETLEHIVREYSRHELSHNKEVYLVENPCEITIETDPVLLRRVIRNMLKNALEAISVKERVTIDCLTKTESVIIRVHNPGVMPEPVQKQIFQRSFSTKGNGRGLGTYSMKLLGEKYLDARVSFSSSKNDGTIFSIELSL